jgi:hypothetical protein
MYHLDPRDEFQVDVIVYLCFDKLKNRNVQVSLALDP